MPASAAIADLQSDTDSPHEPMRFAHPHAPMPVRLSNAAPIAAEAPIAPGDRTAQYSALYRREHPVVLLFAARRCPGGFGQAEDVAHEVFLVAWRKFDDIPRNLDEARGWLLAVTRNQLRNLVRSDARRGGFHRNLVDDALPVVPPASSAAEMQHDLVAAWRRLAPADQEVIALTAWDGLSSEQAATVLGIKPAAYRKRLARARCTLRQLLGGDAT